MTLQEEIDRASSQIHTDGYAMSFGELANLYEDGELDIHPEFQRFYRWDDEQKSRLIESILLGIPLPSVFVAQRSDGVWDVIDGLQRLSTVFQLMGILRDESDKVTDFLQLTRTKYLPSLAGKSWDGDPPGTAALTQAQKLYIKRSKVDVRIIKKESDDKSKYELFQRLNTGGSKLTDQEVRNCILISIDPECFKWLRELASHESFKETLSLSDKAVSEQFDLELALRFILLIKANDSDLRQIGDLGEYLTDTAVRQVEEKRFIDKPIQTAFESTFDQLSAALNYNAFRKYDHGRDRYTGGFLVSGYEAVAIGLGSNVLNNPSLVVADIETKAKSLWSDTQFLSGIGSGIRASSRIPVTVAKGRSLFR